LTAARGLFGALLSDSARVEAVLRRLCANRRASILRVALGPSGTALLSGPQVCAQGVFAGQLAGAQSQRNPLAAIEVLRAIHATRGAQGFAQLDGNFAACIHDQHLREWILATDAAGTHPLYYSLANDLVFGSSAMEVLQASGIAPTIDSAALMRFVADGAIAGTSRTIFKDIHALPSSHALEAAPGERPRLRPLASPLEANPSDPDASLADCADQLRHALFESVETQVRGRRAAVSLSGGLDSSGIAAGLRAASASDTPRAYCFFHSHASLPPAWDERPWAELAARHLGATLRGVTLESSAIPGALARAVKDQEFPFGSPVILAQAELFRVAAEDGIDLILSGHGPDYLFGGGDSHVLVRAFDLLRRGRLRSAWTFLRGAAPYAAASPPRLLFRSMRQGMRRARPPGIPFGVRHDWFRERSPQDVPAPTFASHDGLRRIILEQFHFARLPSALRWEQAGSAAAGVESRWPYLVATMLELSARLSAEQLVSDRGETRPLLRRALRGFVPDAILDRPHPVGFAVPALPWLREQGSWVEQTLRRLHDLPFCDARQIVRLWNRLRAGGDDASAWRAAFILWRWLVLAEWAAAHGVAFE
jgi:asparagine synthase (glutamine-hydrolysing)